MKRAYIGLLIALIAAAAVVAYTLPFYPQYWVKGGAQDSEDGKTVEGRYVIFYKTADEAMAGKYSFDKIGLAGVAKATGQYMLNTYGLKFSSLTVGETYYVSIPNDNPSDPANGYGSDPVSVKITGAGLDLASGTLILAKGKGLAIVVTTEVGGEPAPRIKIWFGNRLYQKVLVAKGEKFVISSTPDIKVEMGMDSPFTLARNIESHSIVVDEGTATARTLSLTAANVASTVYAAGTGADEGKVSSMTVKYTFEEALSEGEHSFKVKATSSGLIAAATTATEIASVEVMGGPVRLIGTPITYPSPFSISKQKKVYIQYTLSTDANIDIYLIGVGGMRIKRWNCLAGSEGGSAGVNKVEWDGRSDQGYLAGNAIYVGTILAKDDNRLLGKVKMTLVD
ncbi:MAG: hypothetical protein WC529_02920 [Candidatus Margulisiibacteriota bacterium]